MDTKYKFAIPHINAGAHLSMQLSDIEMEQEYLRLLREAQVKSAVKAMEEKFRAPGSIFVTLDGKTVFLKSGEIVCTRLCARPHKELGRSYDLGPTKEKC